MIFNWLYWDTFLAHNYCIIMKCTIVLVFFTLNSSWRSYASLTPILSQFVVLSSWNCRVVVLSYIIIFLIVTTFYDLFCWKSIIQVLMLQPISILMLQNMRSHIFRSFKSNWIFYETLDFGNKCWILSIDWVRVQII